jgi:hypothetical protein
MGREEAVSTRSVRQPTPMLVSFVVGLQLAVRTLAQAANKEQGTQPGTPPVHVAS